eukprot:NODE_327_length_10929_cov_0.344137.p2 type:complete len:503 gc:universal NODE_327_length_10929_cov_0.344137:1549-3057(+)
MSSISEITLSLNKASITKTNSHSHIMAQLANLKKDAHKTKMQSIINRIDKDCFISKQNSASVFRLLHDIVRVFDPEIPPMHRKRLSSILLGSKMTGKSTIVSKLKDAIKSVYSNAVLMLLDASDLVTRKQYTLIPSILTEIKKTLPELDLSDVSTDNMTEFLSGVSAKFPGFKLLLIIDEYQEVYIKKADTSRHGELGNVKGLIVELMHISESVGCIGWLTGSSQVLRSLYSKGEHRLYHGIYGDLNGKKYRLCYWLTLQTIDDIIELFKIVNEDDIDESEANNRFLKCGGAMGDLILENETFTDAMDTWGPFVWTIISVFFSKYHSEDFPWKFQEINYSELKAIIDTANENTDNWSNKRYVDEIQVLCDDYVIENRGKDTYCIGHPGYVLNYIDLVEKYASNSSSTKRYLDLRKALECDNIHLFLETMIKGVHDIPSGVNSKIRENESFDHSIFHLLLWICHPKGSSFHSERQTASGRSDSFYCNRFRHGIEFKGPKIQTH